MPPLDKYQAPGNRAIGILSLIALIALAFYLHYRAAAFPQHTIAFRIDRQEAATQGRAFLGKAVFPVEGCRHATIFYQHYLDETYLERQVGVDATERLARERVDLWGFSTRFFRPLQEEEAWVTFSPEGRLTGFGWTIPEARPGARLASDQARRIAEGFLAAQAGVRLADWKLVDSTEEQRPRRVDHAFTWEKAGFRAGDATYRILVGVQGDRVGEYREYLKIPEAWSRSYERERSHNALAQSVAQTAFALFALAIVVVGILDARSRRIRPRLGWWAGGAVFGIVVLSGLNAFPRYVYSYPTTESWDSFLGRVLFGILYSALIQGLMAGIVIAVGEATYRRAFPERPSLPYLLGRGIDSLETSRALLVGTAVGLCCLAYLVVYYLLGRRIGIWSPAEVSYSDLFGTVAPWLSPLWLGFLAATLEEGIFRLFGISFLRRALRSTPAAIGITAVVWGFLHSSYPQSPWFARGVELSIVGVVLGLLFARYGVIVTWAAHYTINAVQAAVFAYAAKSAYVGLSGTLVACLPLLVALGASLAARRRGGYPAIPEEALNKAVDEEAPAPAPAGVEAEPVPPYVPLTKRAKVGLAVAALTGIAVLAALNSSDTGLDAPPYTIGRGQAQAAAEAALRRRHVQADGYRRVVSTFDSHDEEAARYIMETAGFRSVKAVATPWLQKTGWSVRFFRPLQKEEHQVILKPDGRLDHINHTIDERAPGARLSPAQALAVARHYLSAEQGYAMDRQRTVEQEAERRDRRTDYSFTFQEQGRRIWEATFRTGLWLLGDEPSGFSRYIKVPEAWQRAQETTTTRQTLIFSLISAFGLWLLWLFGRVFLDFTREHRIDFRRAFVIAGAGAGLIFVSRLNALPTLFDGYETSTPPTAFIAGATAALAGSVVSAFVFLAALAGLSIALWERYAGRLVPEEPAERRRWCGDALWLTAGVALIGGAVFTLIQVVLTAHGGRSDPEFGSIPGGLDTWVPALATLGELAIAMMGVAGLGAAVLVLYHRFRRWDRVVLCMAGLVVLGSAADARSVPDLVTQAAGGLAGVIGAAVYIRVARNNLFAYLVPLLCGGLLASGGKLLGQGTAWYRVNGVFLMGLALLPIALQLLMRRGSRQPPSQPELPSPISAVDG